MMRRTFRNCTTRSSSKFGSVTVVVILAGKYATHRKWIHREIQIAQTEYEHKKPILGVEPWGSRQISSVDARLRIGLSDGTRIRFVKGIRDIAI